MKHFIERRLLLAKHLPQTPVLLSSGLARTRNYPADTYPFRARSHYLYFGAPAEADHYLLLFDGKATVYREPNTLDNQVWHGQLPSDDEIAEHYQLAAVKKLDDLKSDLQAFGSPNIASLPSCDLASHNHLASFLGRTPSLHDGPDAELAHALVSMRLHHDTGAQDALRQAAQASMVGQRTVMLAAKPGVKESALRALFDYTIALDGCIPSFQPIISTAGEILHNPYYSRALQKGDLLLIDAGAEIESGWAGDLTRVVPVSGTFSPTQRALYNIVDAARRAGVEGVAPGVHYRDLHLKVSEVLTEGLVDLGILKGKPQELVEEGVHSLFFPHGLGHLVGLDVHDMEDLGDLAGYAPGEKRSSQFGLSYLRLSRILQTGMAVTIEPGYYHIPALLSGPLGQRFQNHIDHEVLATYSDVRGIRLEDMVLVTPSGREVLSSKLPVAVDDVEAMLKG